MVVMMKEAKSRPINLSDDIIPRIMPLNHKTIQTYGRKSFLWLGPKPMVHIMDPDDIKEVLTKFYQFQKPRGGYPLTRLPATGLVDAEGDRWAKHRKLINPAFHLGKMKAMEAGECSHDDLLGILLEHNSKEIKQHGSKNFGMTIDEGIEEFKLFYFTGQHQDWQKRAKKEVLQTFGNKKPDFDGLNHLRVVNMILHEVLRLYPPAVAVSRTIYEEIKLGEISLPDRVFLQLPLIFLHHDQELWGDDAKKFNPERFSEAKGNKGASHIFSFRLGTSNLHWSKFCNVRS